MFIWRSFLYRSCHFALDHHHATGDEPAHFAQSFLLLALSEIHALLAFEKFPLAFHSS